MHLSGPHHHAWAPVASAEFEVRGDAYWYVGVVPVEVERRVVVVAPAPVLVVPEPSLTVGIGVDVGFVGGVGVGHHHHGNKAPKRHKGKHKGWRH